MPDADKITVGVSACLVGNKVRYDGAHKRDRSITDILGRFLTYVPVCPEAECGLPVPREPMHLAGSAGNPRLVTIHTGIDHTERMERWVRDRLDELKDSGLCGFIFKSRSPSCGVRGIKVYRDSGRPSGSGTGIFASAFMKRFPLIPVEDEDRLHDPGLRENFIERIFVCRRWQDFTGSRHTARGLVEFHARHKYLIMAHSPKHLAALGRLVAAADHETEKSYIRILTDALRLAATKARNTNVLHHITGYFKNELDTAEKKELREIIDRYRHGLIPLAVPVALLNHYVLKYDKTYLKEQYYLNPHPAELMLKNHV